MAYSKANQTYSKDLIDVEVQMLSKYELGMVH
jgi:hypothetical protein